jgi:hypothetical protein
MCPSGMINLLIYEVQSIIKIKIPFLFASIADCTFEDFVQIQGEEKGLLSA